MWGYNINIQFMVIIGAVVFLNIVLLVKLIKLFDGRGLWLAATLSCVECACYLIPYFAGGRTFHIQEMTEGVLLFLFCYALIIRAEEADAKRKKTQGKRTVLLLVIPVSGLLALGCLFLGNLKPYYFSAICCGCVLAVNLSMFYLYHILVQDDIHVRQRDIYRQQTDHYRNQLEVLEESQSRIRALRHDMKNHMLHLTVQLQQGKCEDALHYLEDMQEELQTSAEYVRTGNKEIDSLLNYKLRKAKHTLSVVESDVNVPVELLPKSFDINVILGNLLDNAIEAAQESRQKWLKLILKADRGVLLIHIANSCSRMPKRKGKGFLTTKGNEEEHGIGLQNVRHMVEKQNGNIEFRYEDEVFLAEVMLYVNEM